MQALDELARALRLTEAGSPDSILLQRHLLDLFQQSGFAFRLKENLRLSKISEFPGGFPSTDAPLSAAELLKQAFHLEVVLRQTGDIITRQQFLLVQSPAFSQGRQ